MLTESNLDYMADLAAAAEDLYGTGSRVHIHLDWLYERAYFDQEDTAVFAEAIKFADENDVDASDIIFNPREED
jgi:hypothetical protein